MQRAYMPQAKTTEHETPPDLFDSLDREFGPFTLDPAALPGQYTAETIIARGGYACCPPEVTPPNTSWRQNGFLWPWTGRVFLNPPYGRALPGWIERVVHEVELGNCELAVALIPARTDTKMWQRYVLKSAKTGVLPQKYMMRASEVRFLPGRLHFSGQKDPAPFPSAVVVWRR